MKNFLFLNFIMLIALFSPFIMASEQCTVTGGDLIVTGAVSFTPDDPVGEVSDPIDANGAVHVVCSGATYREHNIAAQVLNTALPVSGFNSVYATNLDGIGVTFRVNLKNIVSFKGTGCDEAIYILTDIKQYDCEIHTNATESFDITGSVVFVKTKNETQAGKITTIPIVSTNFFVSGGYNFSGPPLWNGTSNVVTSSVGCQLSNGNIQVPFGNIDSTSFQNTGYTTTAHSFSVDLTCDAGANINVTLRGKQNPDTSNTSVLALSDTDSGTAQGVGVQILYDDKPLNIDEKVPIKQSAGGEEVLPFSARYYQTKSEVTAGTANTVATLDLTYQ